VIILSYIKVIDAHCHLDDDAYSTDVRTVIEKAKMKGIIAIINCSLGPNYIPRGIALKEAYPNFIFLTFGLMPYELDEKLFTETIRLIKKYKEHIVGIGEVGLDYYWIRDHEKRKIMIERFREFIHLAQAMKLPLVIHSRSAGKYAISVLIEENARNVLMHSFDGASSWVMRGVEAGFYFSVPTSVVYSTQKQRMLSVLPLENTLLESDSPVLSPIKGERNEPSNIIEYSLPKIAELKKVDVSVIAEETTKNAIKLFNLPISY